MQWIIEKTQEILSNIWVKILAVIPLCFFDIKDREAIMIVALLSIVTIDCVLGVMVANYVNKDFEWGLLGKKFSKKFLLFFFTLSASFIISKAYTFIDWWFYIIGTIITFSEFGSLLAKAKILGLPIKSEYISFINDKIDEIIRNFLNIKRKR